MAIIRDSTALRSLDAHTRARLESLEDVDEIIVKHILEPGYSGAQVVLADLVVGGKNAGAFILKVGDDLDREVTRHATAKLTSIADRIPTISHVGSTFAGTVCIAYSIAGETLLDSRPLARVLQEDIRRSHDVVREVLVLMSSWNIEGRVGHDTTRNYVGRAVGYLAPEAATKLESVFGVQRDSAPLLLFGDNIAMPNPVFCLSTSHGLDSERVFSHPTGRIHGDLHPGNIICVKSRGAMTPFLIDFASFQPDAPTHLDLAYLELSVLLAQVNFSVNAERREWLHLCERLNNQVSRFGDGFGAKFSSLLTLIEPVREYVEMAAKASNQRDDFMLAHHVARVAAGIRLFTKAQDPDIAVASLAFSAASLMYVQEALGSVLTGNAASVKWFEAAVPAGDPQTQSAFTQLHTAVAHQLSSSQTLLCLGPRALDSLGVTSESSVIEEISGNSVPGNLLTEWDAIVESENWAELQGTVYQRLGTPSQEERLVKEIAALDRASWAAVLDFSVSKSAAKALASTSPRAVATARTASDVVRIEVGRLLPLPWIFPRGNVDDVRAATFGLKQWRLPAASALRAAFYKRIAERVVPPASAIFVGFDHQMLARVCDELQGAFSNALQIFVLDRDPAAVGAEVRGEATAVFPLDFSDLLAFLGDSLPEVKVPSTAGIVLELQGVDEESRRISIPDVDGQHLAESFVLLNSSSGTHEDPSRVTGDFYRGFDITSVELALHYDIRRDKHRAVLDAVVGSLDDNATHRYVMHGEPGSGLSTFVTRIAWDTYFERHHAAILVRRGGANLLDNVTRLYDLVRSAILLVAEDEYVDKDDLDRAFEQIQARNIPVVLLEARRVNAIEDDNVPWTLRAELSHVELADLHGKLSPFLAPDAADRLAKLVDRSLFLNLLTAFEEDFIRVDRYITGCLSNTTDTQRQLLKIVMFISRYASSPAPLDIVCMISELSEDVVRENLAQFEDRLILREQVQGVGAWSERHELLTRSTFRSFFEGEV